MTIIKYVSVSCCECGIVFRMEEEYHQGLMDSGNSFYCPNGHRQHYSESTVSKLEKQLGDARAEVRRLKYSLAYIKRSRAAIKGHLTRLKNRIQGRES